MTYLFDTNILLHFIRASTVSQRIEELYDPFSSKNSLLLSVVSEGEVRSIALQSGWGVKKIQILEVQLGEFGIIPIRSKDIIYRYAEIDAYSQGKLPDRPLEVSARNMGKNDLWIAATASVLGAKLLTTDYDFDHLKEDYIDLLYIDRFAL